MSFQIKTHCVTNILDISTKPVPVCSPPSLLLGAPNPISQVLIYLEFANLNRRKHSRSCDGKLHNLNWWACHRGFTRPKVKRNRNTYPPYEVVQLPRMQDLGICSKLACEGTKMPHIIYTSRDDAGWSVPSNPQQFSSGVLPDKNQVFNQQP